MGNCPHGSGVECGHWSWTGQSNDPKRHQRAAVYEEAGEQEFADTKRIRSTAKKIRYLKVMNTMRQTGVVNSKD